MIISRLTWIRYASILITVLTKPTGLVSFDAYTLFSFRTFYIWLSQNAFYNHASTVFSVFVSLIDTQYSISGVAFINATYNCFVKWSSEWNVSLAALKWKQIDVLSQVYRENPGVLAYRVRWYYKESSLLTEESKIQNLRSVENARMILI